MSLSSKPPALTMNVASSAIVDCPKPHLSGNVMCGCYCGFKHEGFVLAADRDHVTLCKYVRTSVYAHTHARTCASVAWVTGGERERGRASTGALYWSVTTSVGRSVAWKTHGRSQDDDATAYYVTLIKWQTPVQLKLGRGIKGKRWISVSEAIYFSKRRGIAASLANPRLLTQGLNLPWFVSVLVIRNVMHAILAVRELVWVSLDVLSWTLGNT